MAWASIEDVKKILHEDDDPVPDSGHVRERLQVNLEEATDVVSAYLETDYDDEDEDEDGVPDDVPPRVRRVVARVALRGFLEPATDLGAEGETHTMGPFGYHVNWSKEAVAGDFYLTDTDKLRIDRYRASTPRGAGHVPMVGAGTEWWD